MLKQQLGAVGRKRLGGLFVFKRELLCQRLHPQNSHGTLLAQNQPSAPRFSKHPPSTQQLTQGKFKMHEWSSSQNLCKEYFNSVTGFVHTAQSRFVFKHWKATHTMACFSIKKIDRRKNIHHSLLNQQTKSYRYSQDSGAESMMWNWLFEGISGILSCSQFALIIYTTLNKTMLAWSYLVPHTPNTLIDPYHPTCLRTTNSYFHHSTPFKIFSWSISVQFNIYYKISYEKYKHLMHDKMEIIFKKTTKNPPCILKKRVHMPLKNAVNWDANVKMVQLEILKRKICWPK